MPMCRRITTDFDGGCLYARNLSDRYVCNAYGNLSRQHAYHMMRRCCSKLMLQIV